MAAIAARRSSRSRSTWWPRSRAIRKRYGLPISGIGGITTWRDAAEFMALGAGNVQVCTAAMTYGFKIVAGDDRPAVRTGWTKRAMRRSTTSIGRATPNVTDWQYLNLNYVTKAHIDQDACIKCGRCHIACEDTSHQAITSMVDGVRHFEVMEEECVGCNLCVNVCPVENCITMEPLAGRCWTSAPASRSSRPTPTGRQHPNNPMADNYFNEIRSMVATAEANPGDTAAIGSALAKALAGQKVVTDTVKVYSTYSGEALAKERLEAVSSSSTAMMLAAVAAVLSIAVGAGFSILVARKGDRLAHPLVDAGDEPPCPRGPAGHDDRCRAQGTRSARWHAPSMSSATMRLPCRN
jgi:NAD-dependent dihydropyrimidine dehydrogenase PreA subunit